MRLESPDMSPPSVRILAKRDSPESDRGADIEDERAFFDVESQEGLKRGVVVAAKSDHPRHERLTWKHVTRPVPQLHLPLAG